MASLPDSCEKYGCVRTKATRFTLNNMQKEHSSYSSRMEKVKPVE